MLTKIIESEKLNAKPKCLLLFYWFNPDKMTDHEAPGLCPRSVNMARAQLMAHKIIKMRQGRYYLRDIAEWEI